MILGILSVILTLILVVGLHEVGHALVARFFSVKILRISIGFGKPLWRWKGANYEWVWGRWPLGGYVELLNSRIHSVHPAQWPVCFDKKPVWVRCIILLAGSGANVMVAWICLTLFYGLGHPNIPPVIRKVAPNSQAAQAGIAAQDRVIEFNHHPIESWQEVNMQIMALWGTPHVLVTLRDVEGRLKIGDLHLNQRLKSGQSIWGKLGITPDIRIEHRASEALWASIVHAVKTIGALIQFFAVLTQQIIVGNLPLFLLLGPMGLVNVIWLSFIQGMSVFCYFIATLSLAVGVVNLVPLPGLDGGLILYAVIEKVRGQPLSIPLEILLYRLATIAFWVLVVQLVLNDVQRYLH